MEGFSLKETLKLNTDPSWWGDAITSFSKSGDWKEIMKESWDKESDPMTGEKWPPRKSTKEKHPLLNKTGKMFKSAEILPSTRKGIEVTSVEYGLYQNKTRRWVAINDKALDKLVDHAIDNIFKEK